jgi:PD-(D/E)XK nuclease superfamily
VVQGVYRIDKLKEIFGAAPETDQDRQESKATGTVKNADLYKMHTYNEAIRRTVGSYVLYPGTDSQSTSLDDTSDRNVYRRYHELIPGIGAFAIKPRAGNGDQGAHGIGCLKTFLHDFLTHQASRFTQTFRINYWTHETIKEPPLADSHQAYALGGPTATAPEPKPPKDTQLLLGFVRDERAAEACRNASVFFCHAVEWRSGVPRNPDGSGEPGTPTGLNFDPFRSDLFAAYCQNTTAPWVAEVKEVRLVSAAERARELTQPLTQMNAAYYYRFQLHSIRTAPRRNVSDIVHHRPGKPIACPLSEFARCSPVPSALNPQP